MRKECFKKDSKGRLRVTIFETDGCNIVTRSGLIGGKLKETTIPCKAKNVGRSNETTCEEQAVLELESRYKKKLDEGYFSTVAEAESTLVVLPMLAKSVNLSKLEYPVITSPKLDGMRCMGQANVDNVSSTLVSRKGKRIETVNHITVPLVMSGKEVVFDAWLDGELYSHGDDFQTNMRLIKKYRKGETERIKYYVYDIYIPNTDFTYRERHKILTNACKYTDDTITVVPYLQAYNETELKAIHADYLKQGYEGTMVRIDNYNYELDKRSDSLLKYKDFIDSTYQIVDIIPNEKTPTQGTVVCKLNNDTFKCGMKMSHKDREELLTNKDKYIGSTAEVRYFETSQDGVPRFPVCVGIRLDK